MTSVIVCYAKLRFHVFDSSNFSDISFPIIEAVGIYSFFLFTSLFFSFIIQKAVAQSWVKESGLLTTEDGFICVTVMLFFHAIFMTT